MKALLIAPMRRAGAPTLTPEAGELSATVLRSRREFSVDLLRQEWVEINSAAINEEGVEIVSCHVAHMSVREFIVAEVDLSPPVIGMPTHDLEEALTRVGGEVAALVRPGGEVRWVSRTLVTGSGESTPSDWMAEEAESIADGSIRVSWGNNEVVQSLYANTHEWEAMCEGLIDAQAIWCELDSSITEATRLLKADIAEDGRIGWAGLDRSLIGRQVMLADLMSDELAGRLQGTRATVAKAQLKAWGVETFHERAVARRNDFESVVFKRMSARSAKYQSLVENILLVMALSAVIQVSLAFIQTAFSGGADEVPGGDAGLMEFLRVANVDLLLSVTMLVLVVLLLAVFWTKKRGSND